MTDPVPLSLLKTVKGERWDRTTFKFSVREATGLYFISLSVGITSRTNANYSLNLSGRRFGGISRVSTAPVGTNCDVISHDFIVQVNAADTLHVSSDWNFYSSSNQLDTSLTIFSLKHVMENETTGFSVARIDSISGSREPFPFDIYLYKGGLHYDRFNHRYTAPSSGIYYFSFSVGLNAYSSAGFTLYKNSLPYVNIVRRSRSHNGIDTISRAVMMRLDQGDQIYLVNEAGQTARSSPMMETSFSGFKYQPTHGNMVCSSMSFAVFNNQFVALSVETLQNTDFVCESINISRFE